MSCDTLTDGPPEFTATIARGDSWPLRVLYKVNGVAIPVTGYTFTAVARREASSVSLGVSMANAASGIVDFELSAAQSGGMASGSSANDLAGRWVVVVTATDAAAKVRRVFTVLLQILT